MRCKAWLLPVTLLQRILAFGVDMDPLSNLRPNNITGLNYYLYRWTGSYYNGTTTIRVQPQNTFQQKECDGSAPGTVIVSYNTSLVAATQTNGHLVQENHDAANPLAFSLKFWMNTKDTPDDPKAPPLWNLAAFHNAALAYSFTGYRDSTPSPQTLRFHYTQCGGPALALYNGTIAGTQSLHVSNISLISEPWVRGKFSNGSASLEIKGIYQGQSTEGTLLTGNVTIGFNGTIDEVRSDRLVPNTHDSTPIWQSTLGYDKDLTGNRPLVQLVAGSSTWMGWGQTIGVLGLMALYVA
ncbi:hypothetical protein PMIN03_012751 [Paraphaeosphaeria minitans]|uniref:Uncharacterized protein n=1 Tax=Paraphaeosphaeria minitans TaxID=565426 RepID=A0A9P6KM35_9PLEO|nr:hypothetical protein PMIN01_11083 [Paraphaeosphaeria minitans]